MGEEKFNDGFEYDPKKHTSILDDLIADDEYEEIISTSITEKEKAESRDKNDRMQVLSIWMNEKRTEQKMKIALCISIGVILIIQIVYINIVIWGIGAKFMSFDEWTIRIFVTGVFAEIVALVKIVVNNIFPKNGNKDFMDFINAFYFNKRISANLLEEKEDDEKELS